MKTQKRHYEVRKRGGRLENDNTNGKGKKKCRVGKSEGTRKQQHEAMMSSHTGSVGLK